MERGGGKVERKLTQKFGHASTFLSVGPHLQTPLLVFPLAFSTFTFLLRPNCPAFSTISPSNHFLSSTFSHSYSALVFLSCPLSLTRFFHFSSPSHLQTPLLAFPLAFSTFMFLLRPNCPQLSTISHKVLPFSSPSHLQTPLLAFPLAFSTFMFLLRPNCPAFSTISPSNHFLSSTFSHSYSALVFLSCPLSLTMFFHFSSPSHLQTPLLAFPLAFSTFTFLLRPNCPAFSTISPSSHFLQFSPYPFYPPEVACQSISPRQLTPGPNFHRATFWPRPPTRITRQKGAPSAAISPPLQTLSPPPSGLTRSEQVENVKENGIEENGRNCRK